MGAGAGWSVRRRRRVRVWSTALQRSWILEWTFAVTLVGAVTLALYATVAAESGATIGFAIAAFAWSSIAGLAAAVAR